MTVYCTQPYDPRPFVTDSTPKALRTVRWAVDLTADTEEELQAYAKKRKLPLFWVHEEGTYRFRFVLAGQWMHCMLKDVEVKKLTGIQYGKKLDDKRQQYRDRGKGNGHSALPAWAREQGHATVPLVPGKPEGVNVGTCHVEDYLDKIQDLRQEWQREDDGMAEKKCERCGSPAPHGAGLLDYCAECSRDLCPACMAAGCCGNVPAISGSDADNTETMTEDGDDFTTHTKDS